MKLYLNGSRKKLRSSRKLEEACHLNVEAKWLMAGFRTISDFRKDNAKCLKRVFREFNRKLAGVLTKRFVFVDGSKFQANNSKDNNFTVSKLDDRLEWLDRHTDEYLRWLADMDEAEDEALRWQLTREELEAKRREKQERLMQSKNGFMAAYNVQTAGR